MQTGRIKKALVALAVATGSIIPAAGSAGAVMRPGGGATAPAPQGTSGGPSFSGHAPDLDMVANNISYKAKSVTAVIQAPAGLALDHPVTISVGYFGYNSADRVTQDYSPTAGNRIVYNFPAGDGQSHQASVQFFLSEPNDNGGVDSLSFGWQPMITPLYDVSFSPMTFTLLNDCALVGNSDITLIWHDPAWNYRSREISLTAGQSWSVDYESSWSEVSASTPLYQPDRVGMYDTGKFIPGGGPPYTASLVPGASAHVGYGVYDDQSDCRGSVEYDQTYTLDTYPSL